MSEPRFSRPRHASVATVLAALDGAFLSECDCYFAGGTRIVLELREYRESDDLGFLCSTAVGYRALRSTIADRSLGRIVARPVTLAREVRVDRYGIRTVLDVGGTTLKFEIVLEGRIGLSGAPGLGHPVPCLDHAACFAEELLANADRWRDDAVLSRDVIDLAFMIEGWGAADARSGAALARTAYGDIVDRAARQAAQRLLDDEAHRRRCVAALRVMDGRTLLAGLRKLARGGGFGAPKRRRAPRA